VIFTLNHARPRDEKQIAGTDADIADLECSDQRSVASGQLKGKSTAEDAEIAENNNWLVLLGVLGDLGG
jgi:hypothetical protein